MENLYIGNGRFPYLRYGEPDFVNIRIIYLSNQDLKFIVDDRNIRRLSESEETLLNYYVNKIENDNLKLVETERLKLNGKYYFRKFNLEKFEADKGLVSKIIKAHKTEDREFFFNLKL